MPELSPILTADSITRVGAEVAGAVVVNGSHGGIYAAYLAGKLRVAAAIFNDAGVGRDQAGIGGLDYLEGFGVPAAAVGYDTARIGDGADMMARGLVTYANASARALGCRPGMACRDTAAWLRRAEAAGREPPPEREGAFLLVAAPPAAWALDSASLVGAEHVGTVVVTGSHGGLLGGRPDTALKYDALAAATVPAAMPRAPSAGRRLTPASSIPIPASLNSAASASTLSAVSGRPPRRPPCEPVATIAPTCSAAASEAESRAHNAGGSAISRKAASSAGGGGRPLGDARCKRAAASRQDMPSRHPIAIARGFACVMTPRAIVSAPSPMRAVS